MLNRKAIIVGIKSTSLKSNEKDFLKKVKPWGVILFSRNIHSFFQAKNLIKQIKSCFNDSHYPILVDEEGGRVSRINNILDTRKFSSKYFGNLYNDNYNKFLLHYEIYVNSISSVLKSIGININTVPLLDVVDNKSNKIIGDRSFSSDPNTVSIIGNHCIKYFSNNKIATVIKHIPGHGSSNLDSHFHIPIVNKTKKNLYKKDFYPFMKKRSLLAMTAHVVYKKYDNNYTATHSKIIINEIIRKKINYKNIIISDDISMKALKFSFEENIKRAYDAGCNLILHCNANLNEMNVLAKISPKLNNFLYKKTSQLYKFLG